MSQREEKPSHLSLQVTTHVLTSENTFQSKLEHTLRERMNEIEQAYHLCFEVDWASFSFLLDAHSPVSLFFCASLVL